LASKNSWGGYGKSVQINRWLAWASEAAGIVATGVPTVPVVVPVLAAQAASNKETSKIIDRTLAVFISLSFGCSIGGFLQAQWSLK
jgi:hypothetical protein